MIHTCWNRCPACQIPMLISLLVQDTDEGRGGGGGGTGGSSGDKVFLFVAPIANGAVPWHGAVPAPLAHGAVPSHRAVPSPSGPPPATVRPGGSSGSDWSADAAMLGMAVAQGIPAGMSIPAGTSLAACRPARQWQSNDIGVPANIVRRVQAALREDAAAQACAARGQELARRIRAAVAATANATAPVPEPEAEAPAPEPPAKRHKSDHSGSEG